MKHKINKGFITQKIGNKTTIFDGEKSAFYTFNETASYVFSKIKIGWKEDKITQALVKRYGVEQKIAKKDFETLMDDLKNKKILKTFSTKPKRQNTIPEG